MIKDDVLLDEPQTIATDYQIERNKPMPNIIHGAIQSKLTVLLDKYSEKYLFVGELSLDTTPGSTPDLCIYPKKKLDIKNVEAKATEPPLTTVEIMSPSQSFNEMIHKVWDLYFPMGVKSAWIVVPEIKGIHVILPGDQNLYFNSGTLTDPSTGIEIEVSRVFEDLA